jgi:hypothetical protein
MMIDDGLAMIGCRRRPGLSFGSFSCNVSFDEEEGGLEGRRDVAELVVGRIRLGQRVDGKDNLSGMGLGMLESGDIDGQSVIDLE